METPLVYIEMVYRRSIPYYTLNYVDYVVHYVEEWRGSELKVISKQTEVYVQKVRSQ